MSAIDKFLPEVRPYAPGVSDQVAYKNIRRACVEFCERTRLWRFEDTFDVVPSDCEQILTPGGSILHDIEAVLFNGDKLEPRGTVDLDTLVPDWRTPGTTGLPQYFTQIEPNTIKIVPADTGTVYVCLRLKPNEDTMDLPDFIYNEYREVIGWGALGRILMVPGQSYSNPDLGAFYANRFTAKLDSLSIKGTKGQQNARKRTRSSFY